MICLFTNASMTGTASLYVACAASLFLPAIAAVTLRTAVRIWERSATLRTRCFWAWRAAFSADLVLATRSPSVHDPRSRGAGSLLIGHAVVNARRYRVLTLQERWNSVCSHKLAGMKLRQASAVK